MGKVKKFEHLMILTPGFPENEDDTTCMPTIQCYLKSLLKLYPHLSITIISAWYPNAYKKYQWNGLEVIAIGGEYFKYFSYAQILLKIFLNSISLNRKKPVDILHSFFFPLALPGNLISRILCLPHVHTIIGRDGASKNKTNHWTNFNNLHLVTLSEFHNQSFFKAFGRNSNSIIPFGLDYSEFSQIRTNNKTIDIIGVGSLYPVKDFSLFIDIILRVLKEFPELKIQIVGGGIENEMLQKKIDASGAAKNIILTGTLPRKIVLEKMQQSKILLHTSSFESQGYVFYEALYSGCHIVSFDVGVSKSSAKWTICESAEEMTEMLKKIITSNLDNNNENPFTIEETVNEYMRIYQSLNSKNQ
jgi:1,2-diacylglycerol 3-alpha-glucosyltransferase